MEVSEDIGILETLLPFAGIIFIITIGVILLNLQFRKNLHKQQLEQEAMKSDHQQALLKTTIEVQEEERQRIARDLHDELGAVLSISRMHLIQLEQDYKENAPLIPRLAMLREFMESALTSTRRISHTLMPVELDKLGLVKTLESLARKIEKASPILFKMEIGSMPEVIPKPIALSLYRIYTELINNTLKHAEAGTITLSLVHRDAILYCSYRDDGKGLPGKISSTGLGLKSLEARANALQAHLIWDKNAGKGFSLCLEVPLSGPFLE